MELAGGLSDVLLRELWKLVCYWRVHSVKADFQSTVPHKNKTRGPTADVVLWSLHNYEQKRTVAVGEADFDFYVLPFQALLS